MVSTTRTSAEGESARPTLSPERRAKVEAACRTWQARLIDQSRRNKLLYFLETKSTLVLPEAQTKALTGLLGGVEVSLKELVPKDDLIAASARLRAARKKAIENFEERGLNTFFLAIGSASWPASDGGRPVAAPVLMLAVKVEPHGRDFSIERDGDFELNLSLMHALQREHGVTIDEEALLGALPDGDAKEEEATDWLEAVSNSLQLLVDAAAGIEGFGVSSRFVVGNFAFQKLSMLRDLRNVDLLARHDLVAAISGDSTARESFRDDQDEVLVPRDLDRIPPSKEYLILDADSSQHLAVQSTSLGRSGVIQGPPGCGKSQTIANIIAALIAEGKKVLFVAEKRAALDVVLDRLGRAGLRELVLDLHGGELRKREVAHRLSEALTRLRSTPPVDDASVQARFGENRARLLAHVKRMHTPNEISGISQFRMYGETLALQQKGIAARTRWVGRSLEAHRADQAQAASQLLLEAAEHATLFLRTEPTDWLNAAIESSDDLRRALEALEAGARSLRALRTALRQFWLETGLRETAELPELRIQARLAAKAAELLAQFRPDVFGSGLGAMASALAPAERGLWARIWHTLTNATYRRAARGARELLRSGGVTTQRLACSLREASDLVLAWRAAAKGLEALPVEAASASSVDDALRGIESAWRAAGSTLPLSITGISSTADLDRVIQRLDTERTLATALPLVANLRRQAQALGLDTLMAELALSQIPTEAWVSSHRFAWLSSCINDAATKESELGGFNGRAHDRVVAEFQQLDAQRRNLAARRVLRQQAEHAVAVRSAHRGQDELVQREANKRSRHVPFRKLAQEAPDVLTGIFPCWMASPLSISHLVPPDRALFDVVLFDEASQVFPEDAIPALLRGRTAVVAGDRHQLPPTNFFADGDHDDGASDAEDAVAGFESVLDQMSSFLPTWSLDWHYRSRDERLIAFSNAEVYGRRLVTFPGIGGPARVQLVEVPWKPHAGAGHEESSSEEVHRTIELIREHVRTRPEESLGVITFGLKHAARIEEALDRAQLQDPLLTEFCERKGLEPFFIKNLERVQGDERAAIILSVGYRKDASGKVPLNFGPLNSAHGYRRLNVAVSRARERMTVVSSFTHLDLDPVRVKGKRGAELLRAYLEFASKKGDSLGDRGPSDAAENPFEFDVRTELERRGMSVVPQWGASSYLIDLVVRHPSQPGRFVLAIECDGASYHSAPTARDRDRLRQGHLEALGWRFHRIWSTDWFQRRESEVERVLAAFKEAVAVADRAPASVRYPTEIGIAQLGASIVRDAPVERLQTTGRARQPLAIKTGRDSIQKYERWELADIVKHIESDGELRTNDEIISEAMTILGMARRGNRIVEALTGAIDLVRRQHPVAGKEK